MPCTHQLARARLQHTCHVCGFDLRGGSDQRIVRRWDDVKRDPTATPIEREIALMHEWNLTLRELRRLEAEVAQTLNANAHLADGDNCTLIRLKRAIGWANRLSTATEGAPMSTENQNQMPAATEGCAAAAGYALVCRSLNRLFWKCPIPERMRGPDETNDWAEYWLGELRDGPEGCEIEGITWDRESCEFVVSHTVKDQATASTNL